MGPTIIIIIAIILAILIMSFIWKLLKTVIKVVLVVAIALAIFALITTIIDSGSDINVDNETMVNITNVTDDVTARVTGFVTTTFEKAKLNAKKTIAENMLEDAELELRVLDE